jgi:hypothetical protein
MGGSEMLSHKWYVGHGSSLGRINQHLLQDGMLNEAEHMTGSINPSSEIVFSIRWIIWKCQTTLLQIWNLDHGSSKGKINKLFLCDSMIKEVENVEGSSNPSSMYDSILKDLEHEEGSVDLSFG